MQMLKKLFTKYFLEVVPSIVATVVGAYIVTHYVNARPDADKPKAAVTAPAQTSKDVGKEAAGTAAKDAGRKPVKAEPAAAPEKLIAAPEKSVPEKAEKQDAASEPRRHQPAAKAAAKPVAPPAEANAQADERRDANDLARAAIERLRNAEPRPPESRAPEAARASEPARPIETSPERGKVNSAIYAPAAPPAPSSVQALPPAVAVIPPPGEAAAAQVKSDDPLRPTPPAEIPSRPLDLHARGPGSVAEEVVSAAKSVFQAVVPR